MQLKKRLGGSWVSHVPLQKIDKTEIELAGTLG